MKGWFFKFVCPGNSLSTEHDRLLLLKNATVNRNLAFDDVCKEKHVKIVYYNRGKAKFVNPTSVIGKYGDPIVRVTGKLIKYKLNPTVKPNVNWLSTANVAMYWELEDMFFKQNNIKPEWLWIDYKDKGLLNETTGQWDGGVGHIQRDEADYAVKEYVPSYTMSKVVAFSPTRFTPLYWASRRAKVSPIWNLFGLFTKVNIISDQCWNK